MVFKTTILNLLRFTSDKRFIIKLQGTYLKKNGRFSNRIQQHLSIEALNNANIYRYIYILPVGCIYVSENKLRLCANFM